MSEILGEARVIIRPDTTGFRRQLQEEVNRAVSQTAIPALSIPLAAGAGLATATAATTALAAAQRTTETSTLGLATGLKLENQLLAQGAVLLEANTVATQQKAGADVVAAGAARAHAVAESQVGKAALANTAGLLGLRGAVLTAGGAFIAATAAIQAFFKSTQLAAEFERELEVFRVTAGATAEEIERVSEAATALGRDITLPGVSAQDAAQTLSLLARAGLDVDEALGAVRGTLQLATAAQIENAQATELVANALNSFRLAGEDATRVADLFAGAANESQGSIVDMGIALRQVSAVASGLGISLEDTVTLLTQLSRAGLSSSDAGTSLRQTFLRLIQNLPKVNEEVRELGLNLRDASGNIRPEIFEELGQKLRKLTPAARQAAIANLGGADAIRTYLLLSREAVGTFDSVQASITQQGLASEQAAARTSGLTGDVEAAKNEMAALGTTVGQVASGPLSFFARTVSLAAGAINDFNREAEETGVPQQLARGLGDLFNSFERVNLSFRQGITGAKNVGAQFTAFDVVVDSLTASVDALAASLNAAKEALVLPVQARDEGLGITQILNRVSGFDSAETRARIRGDNQELLAVLQAEQDFLRRQLERQFVQNRPALRDRLQDALLGSIQDVESISKQGAVEAKRAADEARRAKEEADRAFLAVLGTRREDAANAAAVASAEGSTREAIRAQDRLQALIRAQIAKIRERIRDEQTRKEAIRALRKALNESRREEEDLRREQREEQQARIDDIQQLNIAIAQETGNEAALERAIQARIDRINKQIKAAKGEQRRVKELILERERLKNQLEELTEQEKDNRKTAQEFFFEQLQAQQGFAANLLGNIIPRGATSGLVGVPAPPGQPPRLEGVIRAEAAEGRGRAQAGPTAGQASTTNDILLRILDQLKALNSGEAAPEAKNQRKMGASTFAGGGGMVPPGI